MDGKVLHSIRMWEISTQDGSVPEFCNSNVEASVNGCSYENGVHGIATMSKGRTVVNNTTLARNNAREANTEQCGQKGNGGGIFLNGGTIIWNSGTICENQADRGGAIYLKDGEILLKDGSFYGNRAQNRGGGNLQIRMEP